MPNFSFAVFVEFWLGIFLVNVRNFNLWTMGPHFSNYRIIIISIFRLAYEETSKYWILDLKLKKLKT